MPGEQNPQPAMQPEFDDATLIAAGRLAIALGRNKDTGRAFRKLVKKVDPSRTFPADDVADLREEMAQRDKEREEKIAHEQAIQAQESQRKLIAGRFSADEVKEIEAIMTKHGLADYEVGEELYLSRRKPRSDAAAATNGGRTWELPQAEGLFENPGKWATDEAVKVIDEIKSGVLRPV